VRFDKFVNDMVRLKRETESRPGRI